MRNPFKQKVCQTIAVFFFDFEKVNFDSGGAGKNGGKAPAKFKQILKFALIDALLAFIKWSNIHHCLDYIPEVTTLIVEGNQMCIMISLHFLQTDNFFFIVMKKLSVLLQKLPCNGI